MGEIILLILLSACPIYQASPISQLLARRSLEARKPNAQESECALVVSILLFFLRFTTWILELFRQCGIVRFSFYSVEMHTCLWVMGKLKMIALIPVVV